MIIDVDIKADVRDTPDFLTVFNTYDWNGTEDSINAKTSQDVLNALQHSRPGLADFMALLSPAAAPFLEQMAKRAQQLTRQRFGRAIRIFAPLYLSNKCQNICTYCGFSLDNK